MSGIDLQGCIKAREMAKALLELRYKETKEWTIEMVADKIVEAYLEHAKAPVPDQPVSDEVASLRSTLNRVHAELQKERGFTGMCSAHQCGEDRNCKICYPTEQPDELSKEILPCPFCDAELVHEDDDAEFFPFGYWLHPDNGCLFSRKGISIDTKEDITLWNTRAPKRESAQPDQKLLKADEEANVWKDDNGDIWEPIRARVLMRESVSRDDLVRLMADTESMTGHELLDALETHDYEIRRRGSDD